MLNATRIPRRAVAAAVVSVFVMLGGLGCSDAPGPAEVGRRPNVVLIMADDLGYGDLSLTGNDSIRTPNIDGMAAEGASFSQFYTSGSVCSPTRAGLLTGRYQQRAGIHQAVSVTDDDLGLEPEQVLLGELLRDAGYATGLVGKWHLGKAPRHSPIRNGFDEFVGFLNGFIDYYTHHDRIERPDLWRGEERIEDPRYITALIEDEAIRFIDVHQEEPFFLFVSHASPHRPYQPPGEEPRSQYPDGSRFFAGSGSPEVYAEMVEDLDRSVGRIVEALADRDLLERTLLLFMSDNGPVGFGTAGPLRGLKGSFFEGGIRTPMLAVWPGRIAGGQVVDVPAISIDLLPTIAELAEAEIPADLLLDGKSLWPLIDEGAQVHHDALFWRLGPPDMDGELAVRRGRWKLHISRDGQRSLFDLAADPNEERDLSAAEPDVAGDLEMLLRTWESGVL